MKLRILMSFVVMLGGGFALLFAPCKNNAEGKEHVKVRGQKKKASKKFICNFKTKEFYSKRKGALKRFYKGDACVWCGCSSSEHTDSGGSFAPAAPVVPAAQAPVAKKQAKKTTAKKTTAKKSR